MAEQFLDGTQVAAMGQKVGGEGVAQGVGCGAGGQAQPVPQIGHQRLHAARAERPAAHTPEQRRTGFQIEGTEIGIARAGLVDRGQDGHDPSLVALAGDAQGLAHRMVAPVERQRFGNAKAAAIEQEQDSAVTRLDPVAAVAMAPQHLGKFWTVGTVWLGGVLGIVAMRFVAGYFIILLNRFKGLAAGAYFLVAWIGVKLVIGGLHNAKYLPWEMHEGIFWGGMAAIIVLSMLMGPRSNGPSEPAPIEEPVAQ